MKKLRIKDLLLKYPALDRARVHGFAAFFRNGLFFYDTSYRRLAVIPEATRPYVSTAGAWGFKPGALDSLKPAVYAYFHGHMHVLLGLVPRERMTLIVSNSRDGEAIARAAEDMGYQVARGSRTEGGVRGALKLLGAATDQRSILFPVDGPRGPKLKVKPEVIRIAQLAGLPIIPVVARPRTMDVMGTWDSYNCPFMHSLMVYIYGAPFSVQPDWQAQGGDTENGGDREKDGGTAKNGGTENGDRESGGDTEMGGDAEKSTESERGGNREKGATGSEGQIEALRAELETYMLALKERADCFFEKETYPLKFD